MTDEYIKYFIVQKATQDGNQNSKFTILQSFKVHHMFTHSYILQLNSTSAQGGRCRGESLLLGLLVLDGQVEFELCRELVLRVQSV